MATSTYLTFLMHSEDGSSYEKLCDIKEFPDLGGEPETLDTTTLSDKMTTSILGIQSMSSMSFTANYDKDEFKKLDTLRQSDLTAPSYYAVWFGGTENSTGAPTPTGALGKFSCKGQLSVFVSGGGVNEVRNMTITVAPSTPVEFAEN